MSSPAPPLRQTWHRWMIAFDLTLLGVTALLFVLVARDVQGLPRVLATLAFACLVPGGALVTRLPFREHEEILAMSLTLSLCILAITSLVMVWLGMWHPLRLTAGLGAAAGVILLLDLAGHLAPARDDDPKWPAG
jgi:hypothetical protein